MRSRRMQMAPPPDSGDATNNDEDDPLGGMDPMAWLESLAARQGANPDELTTAANLDIAEPPADTVIDEPGYVDYDPFSGSGVSRPAEPVASTPEPEELPATPVDADTLSWLQDMAAQQETEATDIMGGLDMAQDSDESTVASQDA